MSPKKTLLSEQKFYTPNECASYSAAMLSDLRRIAARNGQELLAHLLDLAEIEAERQAKLVVNSRDAG